MALCWDLYVRLPGLDGGVVERFLDRRIADWRTDEPWLSDDAAVILRESLAGRSRGDVLYASRTLDPALDFVIVAFGDDGILVLGVAIDMRQCEVDEAEVLPRAKQVLAGLLVETGAAEGFLEAEHPPPLSEIEWAQGMAYSTYSLPRPSSGS